MYDICAASDNSGGVEGRTLDIYHHNINILYYYTKRKNKYYFEIFLCFFFFELR